MLNRYRLKGESHGRLNVLMDLSVDLIGYLLSFLEKDDLRNCRLTSKKLLAASENVTTLFFNSEGTKKKNLNIDTSIEYLSAWPQSSINKITRLTIVIQEDNIFLAINLFTLLPHLSRVEVDLRGQFLSCK